MDIHEKLPQMKSKYMTPVKTDYKEIKLQEYMTKIKDGLSDTKSEYSAANPYSEVMSRVNSGLRPSAKSFRRDSHQSVASIGSMISTDTPSNRPTYRGKSMVMSQNG